MPSRRRPVDTGVRKAVRSRSLRGALLLSAVSVGVAHAQAGPQAASEPPDPRPVIIQTTVGVQETFTDNVRLSSTNRESDLVTTVHLGLDATLNGARTKGALSLEGAYDFYADADDLNGWTLRGIGSGSYAVIENFLSLDFQGAITNGNLSTFGSSAVERAGVEDRVQVSTLSVGPKLTTQLGDYADLDAAARISWIAYDPADGSNVAQTPSDATLLSTALQIDTAERLSGLQFTLMAGYEEDNDDYRNFGLLGSAYVEVSPGLSVIGRLGYDNVSENSVVDIDAATWAVGLRYRPHDRASFSIEGGERYEEPTWAASADVQVTNRFYLNASYSEQVEPDQGFIVRDLTNFVGLGEDGTPLAPTEFDIDGNLYDSTSLHKTAQVEALYVWEAQSLRLSAHWRDRYFYDTQTNDRSLTTSVAYFRQIRPDLEFEIGADFGETYDSPIYGESRSYELWTRLSYDLNPTVRIVGGYAHADDKQRTFGGQSFRENALFVSLRKTF